MEIQEIRIHFAEKVKSLEPLGKKLKFILDGDVMLIDGTLNENLVHESDEVADCTITMTKETYLKLQRKEINPLMATMSGKIKIKGDLSLAKKLKQLM